MVRIGSAHGVQFGFDAGLLSGIQIESHLKTVRTVKEQMDGGGALLVSTVSQPYPDISDRVPGAEEDFVPDTSSLLRATQELGGGRRRIEVCQYILSKSAAAGNSWPRTSIAASLLYVFALTKPVTWQFFLGGVDEVIANESGQLRLQLDNDITVELESSESFDVEREIPESPGSLRIKVALPSSESLIKLMVTSVPSFDVGETMIICKSSQLREAAIVASCLPAAKFTPVVVSERPSGWQSFSKLYKEFEEVSNKQRQQMGSDIDEATGVDSSRIVEILRTSLDRTRLQKELTPFRSWLKHNQTLSDILVDMRFRRVVILFAPEARDLFKGNIEPMAPLGEGNGANYTEVEEFSSFLPPDVQWVLFLPSNEKVTPDILASSEIYYYANLPQLADLSWERLGPTGKPPTQTLGVPMHGDALYLLGLYRALRLGIPLRPLDSPCPPLEDACKTANEGINSEEAVLIEDTGDASGVVGVIYAHHRKARIVVSPCPELSTVELALDEYRKRQGEASKALEYVGAHVERTEDFSELSAEEKSAVRLRFTKPHLSSAEPFKRSQFLDAIRRYFSDDWRSEAIADIEAAVSAQVPGYVVTLVGNRRLTAFTKGIPYSFVKRDGADWSCKAIGHIVNDSHLVILREIHRAGCRRPPITFDLVFDPGFFRTSETQHVLGALEKYFTRTILLAGDKSSWASMVLAAVLPVEFIFFNTHGSDDRIYFGDMPLMNYHIVQWITLASGPIVFNNSCLSWVGVGREFVRVGARGYIGTLWSVNAESAADFAKIVMRRLIEDGAIVSGSIRETEVDRSTERSYIFIGTANAVLDRWVDASSRGLSSHYLSALDLLLHTSVELMPYHPKITTPVTEILHREVQYLKERFQGEAFGNSIDLIDVLIKEIEALAGIVDKLGSYPVPETALISECLANIDQLAAPEDIKLPRRALLYHLSGRIKLQRGQLAEAADDLRRSIEYAEAAGDSAGKQCRLLAVVFKFAGQWQMALQFALKAKEQFESEKDEGNAIVALGEVGQISKRLGMLPEALRYAEEGYQRSVRIGDLKEQAVFRADQAQIHMARGDYDKALEMAGECISIARSNFNSISELKAHGIIARCYIEKGDFSAAEDHIIKGLEQARRMGDSREEAGFLFDLGDLRALLGDFEAATDSINKAILIYVEQGNYEIVVPALERMISIAIRVENWPLVFDSISQQAVISSSFDQRLQVSAVVRITKNIQEVIQIAPYKDSEAGLRLILSAARRDIQLHQGRETDSLKLLSAVALTLLMWLEGKNEDAAKYARMLDGAMASVCNLEAFVTCSYAGQSRPTTLSGKLRDLWRKHHD